MGGCSVVIIMFLGLPIMILMFCLFLGVIGMAIGSLLVALIASIALWMLTKKGFFETYRSSEIVWKNIAAKWGKIVLILVVIGAWLCTIGSAAVATWVYMKFHGM